jgi:hypothetical protein
MALGISTEGGGGNYTPTVKINAKQGRVYRVDRSQDGAGNWQTDEVEITSDFQFVPDFDELQIGWMYFAAGQAPNFAMVKLGEQMPDRPNADHRQGVRLKVKLGKTCGGDIREIAATAKTILGPIDKLHDEYLAGAGSNPGKAPVVRMTGMKKIDTKTQHGTNTNFEPQFEILKWVDKPAEFTGGQPANEAKEPAQTVVQAKTTSQTKPDPEPDTGEEF